VNIQLLLMFTIFKNCPVVPYRYINLIRKIVSDKLLIAFKSYYKYFHVMRLFLQQINGVSDRLIDGHRVISAAM